jgi:hypothetical protein
VDPNNGQERAPLRVNLFGTKIKTDLHLLNEPDKLLAEPLALHHPKETFT